MKTLKNLAWEFWLPVVLLLVWFFASASSTSFYWSPLSDIIKRTGEIWFFDGIVTDLLPSLRRILVGFCIAMVIGVLGGVLLGMARRFEEIVRPLLEFLRSTPGVAMLPIATLFLGIGEEMKVFMISLACTWPILLNTIDGVRSVEPVLLQVAKSYRMTLIERIRFIYVPNAAPQIFAGGRLSLAIAAVVMVVTEMIGSPGGIGYFVLSTQRNFDVLAMWTGIVMLGLLGYLLNLLFRVIENKLLNWYVIKNA